MRETRRATVAVVAGSILLLTWTGAMGAAVSAATPPAHGPATVQAPVTAPVTPQARQR